jgi:hypothetical protein
VTPSESPSLFSQPPHQDNIVKDEDHKDLVKRVVNDEYLEKQCSFVDINPVGDVPLECNWLIAVGRLILILAGPCKC